VPDNEAQQQGIPRGSQTGIRSNPPPGKKKIKNIYWDQDTQEIVVVTEE